MKVEKIIGGEFECIRTNVEPVKNNCVFTPFTFSSGRTALYNIITCCIEKLQCKKVILPDYLCDSIIKTVESIGVAFDFYHILDNLIPDWGSISTKCELGGVILFIDYYGIIDNEPTIRKIKEEYNNIVVIKDLVQAPYHIDETSLADFQFTSFRKCFAVPDGSWVITKHQINQPVKEPKFAEYKMAASYLKSIRQYGDFGDDIYLDLYSKGEGLVGSHMDEDMSDFTKQHLLSMDWKRVSLLRKRNSDVVIKGLKTMGITPIAKPNETAIPLFIPIALENRDIVRRRLFESNIFLPIHWPLEETMSKKYGLTTGAKYAKEELSIIVDQRYGTSEMTKILETLEKSMK